MDPNSVTAIRMLKAAGWVKRGALLSRRRRLGVVETIDLATATYHRPEIHNEAGETSTWADADQMLLWFSRRMTRKLHRQPAGPMPIASLRHHWRDELHGKVWHGKAVEDRLTP